MIIPAQSIRRSAYLFNWGSILAVLIPFPLVAFWFGVSIFVYAFNKGHPDPRVAFFTQRAANRFYLMIGITIAIGKFTPENDNTLYYYLGIWLIAVLLVMVPLGIFIVSGMSRGLILIPIIHLIRKSYFRL